MIAVNGKADAWHRRIRGRGGDGRAGRHDHTHLQPLAKARALGIGHLPDRLVGAALLWRNKVHGDVILLARCHLSLDGCRLATHRGATRMDQPVVGIPGAGTRVLDLPHLGELLARASLDRIVGAPQPIGVTHKGQAVNTLRGRSRCAGSRRCRCGQKGVDIQVFFGELSDDAFVMQVVQDAIDLGLERLGAFGQSNGVTLQVQPVANDLDAPGGNRHFGGLEVQHHQV